MQGATRDVNAQPEQESTSQWRTLAGYRVVRKLGAGERAVVYLGHSLGSDDAEPSAALKVFGVDVEDSSIAVEVAALSAARSAHVVRLVDVAAGTGEPRCLVLERLSGGSLSALLRERASVRAGEAVTILASVARGLEDLHRAGFAHGRVTLATVMFTETGRPVLIGLGHAVAAGEPSNASDYGQLGIIAQALLSRVDREGRAEAIDAIVEWLAMAHGGHIPSRRAGELEELVFAIAQPVPVRLRTRSRGSPGRPVPETPRGAHATSHVEVAHATLADVAHATTLAEVVRAAIDGRPLRLVLGTLAERVRPRRRLLWFSGALAAVLVALALTSLPSGRANSLGAGSARGSPVPTGSSVGSAEASAPGSAPGSPDLSPVSSTGASSSGVSGSSKTSAAGDEPASADDPVAATAALLVARTRCLADASLACLEGTDQIGSALLDADQSTVARARGGTA
ncbi:MAG: eukaryotic-like serine/threonine-protein kinase, partial [Microbacteriaceae bacterium]|nr:eukaryotic-like serine/threonine-protein kinase [Microbacteriaceae bacterium]